MKIRFTILSTIIVGQFLLFVNKGIAQKDPFPEIYQRVIPSVVKVFAETKIEAVKDMMSEVVTNAKNRLYWTGTGFFISQEGLIMTANHIISVASGPISILFWVNGRQDALDAKVVFSDSLADIAVLKIPRENCAFLELLDPVNIPVGTDLAFIGFPLDYEFPIASKSVLSAKVDIPLKQGYPSRHQLVINQFVNHGNSGGPLFIASTGQVIGVVSWRPSPNYKNRMIILPKNYTPIMLAGGVDPIALSVETYNENLKYIGEISQFGIGFVPSVEYAKQFIK